MGTCRRAVRMIQVASWAGTPAWEIRYTGVDLFEARGASEPPGPTLKMAHQIVRRTGARVRLLPGDPFTVLSRAANTLAGTDLLVIAGQHDPGLVDRVWFYVPRMLHAGSAVFIERWWRRGRVRFDCLGPGEIQRLATRGGFRRAA